MFDALSYALAELDDPMIGELVLESVTPAPDASRVQINLMPARADIDREAALAALARVTPELRSEIAAELTRKRVPELVFQLGYRPET